MGFVVSLGAGDGTFGRAFHFAGEWDDKLIIGEFDNDGDGDIATMAPEGDAVLVYESRMFNH
jgi:hypothetical protein